MRIPWRLSSSAVRLLAMPLPSKFIAYSKVGAVCALFDIAAFWVLLGFTGLTYVAFAIAFLLATGLNYCLTVRFVFERARHSRETTIALVYAVSAIAICINFGFFSMAIEVFGAHPILAKVLGIGAGFGWNFSSRYFWIFRS